MAGDNLQTKKKAIEVFGVVQSGRKDEALEVIKDMLKKKFK